ncbi:MAG TPA: Gfo/Idh/MocA family oxidoreductase [Candidatus Omnitrophota bacterium]|nr:Gfo/Idh/MocA family oxidoreductase [Candidatus Omnitrophota bacterium]
MGKTKIKVGVIGIGYWGINLVRVFSQLNALTSICDDNADKLKAVAQTYPGVKRYTSYQEMLLDPEINAVVIATPAITHFEIAKKAFHAQKDVYVEKPLSLTPDEGAELITLAHRMNRILMVGHILEYHPAINKLKTLIEKGTLGNIQYIYSNRLNLGKIRKEENILWSFAPHDISVMLLLLNKMPDSVLSSGGNYLHHDIADVTVSMLNFPNGVKGHIFVSWLHPYKEQKLIVVGDKKMAVFDDLAEKKLLVYNHTITWVNGLPTPKKKIAKPIAYKTGEPLKLECAHFLECVRLRKIPKTDGKSALRVLKVLNACQKSLERNGIMINLKTSQANRQYYVHPSAEVDSGAHIGKGTRIWHSSHVMKGAIIGKNCRIGQNVFIGSKASIGDNVKIQNNVSVYDAITLENGVFCGPSVVFTNVINPRSLIERKNEYLPTVVKSEASIGANATVVCGNTIGEHAFIGAGAVVTKDVLPYSLVYGNPASHKGWMCSCGIKLSVKNKKAVCPECKQIYYVKRGTLQRG